MKIHIFIILISLFKVFSGEPQNLKFDMEYVHFGESGTVTSKVLFRKEDSLFFYQETFDLELITYGKWLVIDDSIIMMNTRWKPMKESKCQCRDVNSIAAPGLDFVNVMVNAVEGGLEITFGNYETRYYKETDSVSFSIRNLVENYENL